MTPNGLKVLVKAINFESKSQGGIILSAGNPDEKERRAELVKIIDYKNIAFTNCFGTEDVPPPEEEYALIHKNSGQLFKMIEDDEEVHYRIVETSEIALTMDKEFAKKYCESNYPTYQINL